MASPTPPKTCENRIVLYLIKNEFERGKQERLILLPCSLQIAHVTYSLFDPWARSCLSHVQETEEEGQRVGLVPPSLFSFSASSLLFWRRKPFPRSCKLLWGRRKETERRRMQQQQGKGNTWRGQLQVVEDAVITHSWGELKTEHVSVLVFHFS